MIETVTFAPKGRFGNTLFQYTAAKLLAHFLGAKVHNPLSPADFHNIVAPEKHPVARPTRTIGDREFKSLLQHIGDGDAVAELLNGGSRSLLCAGYFQYAWLLDKYQDIARTFFTLANYETNDRDLAMHVRLGDFVFQRSNSGIIDYNRYVDILRRKSFGELYIVTDRPKSSAEERYLRKFDEFNPTVVSNSPIDDFEFLRRFRRIILSNSTFSWWAAYLGAAEEIVLPENYNHFGITRTGCHEHQEIHDVRGKGERIPCTFINIYERDLGEIK
jgi:hypothetical protein